MTVNPIPMVGGPRDGRRYNQGPDGTARPIIAVTYRGNRNRRAVYVREFRTVGAKRLTEYHYVGTYAAHLCEGFT